MSKQPFTLFKFQQTAIKAASTQLTDALTDPTVGGAHSDPFKFALKAPTGSGKTLMMLHTIQNLINAIPSLVVLWLASKNLADQTAQRLARTLQQQNTPLNIPFTQIASNSDLQYQPGHLYVVNWEACSTSTHLLIRANEQGLNLSGFLQEVRNANSPILVVVDEAHAVVDSTASNGHALVYDTIQPNAIFGASATFTSTQLGNFSVFHSVKRDVVVSAGLIVDDTIAYCIPKATDPDLLLEAYNLQKELTLAYAQERSPIKPLIIVQVPNSDSGAAAVSTALSVFTKVGYLAGVEIRTHLSDKSDLSLSPEELATVADPSSPVKVLLFKVGLATGWDCPRAKILVALRDTKSDILNHQVLGRIARQPEARRYSTDLLNHAYLFTSLEDTAILKQVAAVKKTAEDPHLSPVSFPSAPVLPPPVALGHHWLPTTSASHHLSISADFTLANSNLDAKLATNPWAALPTSATITQISLDSTTSKTVSAWQASSSDLTLLMTACETIAQQHLQTLKTTFDPAFAQTCVRVFFLHVQDYALSDLLISPESFLDSWRHESLRYDITAAFQEYIQDIVPETNTSPAFIDWTQPHSWLIPNLVYAMGPHAPSYLPLTSCAVQDHTAIPVDSQLEVSLMELLENKSLVPNILWWLKNPRTSSRFAIPYLDDNNLCHFVPDFLVITQTSFGPCVFVLDTKGTNTASTPDAVAKHAALTQWAARISTDELPVLSGFVQNNAGVWWLHEGNGASPYDYTSGINPDVAHGWTDLVAALNS